MLDGREYCTCVCLYYYYFIIFYYYFFVIVLVIILIIILLWSSFAEKLAHCHFYVTIIVLLLYYFVCIFSPLSCFLLFSPSSCFLLFPPLFLLLIVFLLTRFLLYVHIQYTACTSFTVTSSRRICCWLPTTRLRSVILVSIHMRHSPFTIHTAHKRRSHTHNEPMFTCTLTHTHTFKLSQWLNSYGRYDNHTCIRFHTHTNTHTHLYNCTITPHALTTSYYH